MSTEGNTQPSIETPSVNFVSPQVTSSSPLAHGTGPKKTIAVITIVIILVVIASVMAFMLLHKSGSKSGGITQSNSNAVSFSFMPNSQSVQYNGADVVQACNLLPLDGLARAGYSLDTGAGTDIFYRTYFNGGGNPNLMLGKLGFTVIGGSYFNTCHYLLAQGLDITTIVVQPSYVQGGAFSTYVANQNPVTLPAISGVTISQFKDPTDGTPDFGLISPDKKVGVQFAIQSVIHNQNPAVLDNAEKAIVKVIANNLVVQSQKATGPAKLAYAKQAFPATIADACSLTDNNDFKQLYSVDQAPLVTENGGGLGLAKLNGHDVTFVDNECDIESYINEDDAILNPNPDFALPDVQYLTIRSETYLDATDAQAAYTGAAKVSEGAVPISDIGDQAFFATEGGGLENPLIFRKGRFIVELSPAQLGVPSTQTIQQIVNELTPLGQKVAKEL